jgi:ABC-type antimicrobial peptide transport system permease subunit
LRIGDTLKVAYQAKHLPDSARAGFVVTTIHPPLAGFDSLTALVRDHLFMKAYHAAWPAPSAWQPDSTNPLFPALSTEWILLKRAKNTQEMMKQFRNVAKMRQKGCAVDVRTMYESASDVLKLEVALNLITLVAVMVLFFIILIGVINTLRMTIRERTREIGTVRAIGMQRNDVRNSFILETSLLAFFSAVAGTILAFVAMGGLSLITIDPGENPMGMILSDGHLHFVPTTVSVIGYIVLIIAIATATAFFPARRAAKLSAAAALRHYE